MLVYNELFYLQAFQKELVKRTSSVASVRESAKELLSETSDEGLVSNRLIDMTTKWDKVCRMSLQRQECLEEALQQVSISLPDMVQWIERL